MLAVLLLCGCWLALHSAGSWFDTPDYDNNPGPRRYSHDPLARQLAASNNSFGIDVWRALEADDGNLTISPASLYMGLSMARLGARGQTATELEQVLYATGSGDALHQAIHGQLRAWNSPSRGPRQLSMANRLFGDRSYNFAPEFVRETKELYRTELEEVNFRKKPDRSRERINDWIAEQTRDRLRETLPPGSVTSSTRLALTNVAYFKGRWATPFEEEVTIAEPFYPSPDESFEVWTMHQIEPLWYGETETLQVLELPYQGSHMAMLVILPKELDGLADLERELDVELLDVVTENMTHGEVRVALPRFRVATETPLDLTSLLGDLGAPPAFDATANFTGMADTDGEPFYLDALLHQAFVEVDEVGTEAAAATAYQVWLAEVEPSTPPVFRADHPFLFLIQERSTGLTVFMGRVTEPEAV